MQVPAATLAHGGSSGYGFEVMPHERSTRRQAGDTERSRRDVSEGASLAGKGNTAARTYARSHARAPVQSSPRAGRASEHALDASQPASAQTEDVTLQAGEALNVEVWAQEAVELVVLSEHSGVVAQQTGPAPQATYVAQARERVRVQTRPAAGGLQIGPAPSARVMISVEPAGRAQSSLEGDGTAYLSARQHLLLNLFGVNPTSLHPASGLELARALDALEVVARSIAARPEAAPPGVEEHMLTVEHGQSGTVEHATYRLVSGEGTLTLATTFDAGSGALHCVLGFEHQSGARVHGALTHTVALSDGAPVLPAADPVGDYVKSEPGAYGALDDFADVTAGAEEAGSQEGIGSFVAGAVAGDYADNDSWSAVGGQVAMGFVPIAGQVADARDISAAGSDVLAGEEGAWLRLGISIIAVIPGLDFLKGGSKAGNKALREASEGAVDGVSKAGLKRLGKVLSREAAARAARELKRLAVARREMLERMQSLLLDEGLSESTRNVLRKVRNSVQDHLQPGDLSGALRDKHGLPVRRSGSGEAWDHLREVRDGINALERVREQLRRELYRLESGSDAYRKLSRELDGISEMARHIEAFLEIK